jgi:hypothetical protein
MNLDRLSNDEITLAARALSIHRVALRRKIERLNKGSSDHESTVAEIIATTALIDKFNQADLQRIGA